MLHVVRATQNVPLSIAGAVAVPGSYTVSKQEATLSLLLERAGWFAPSGSDQIKISFLVGDEVRIFMLRGGEFYANDRDFALPAKSTVYVFDCVALGLGIFSAAEFTRLEEKRRDYLERKHLGKVETHELFQKKRIGSP